MRKRSIQILFRLTEEEAEYLYSLAERPGYSKQTLLQLMIMGYHLHKKLDPEFYKIMQGLSAIGNHIDQFTAEANALSLVDTPMPYDEAKRWRDFRLGVSRSYLVPREKSG